jgi:nucleotide-binding universal stress UspA family protein
MMHRVLVAVDDSPAALAAARLAVQLARDWKADVRAVTVVFDHEVIDRLGGTLNAEPLQRRRGHAASSLLHYVERIGRAAGVRVETVQSSGPAAEELLKQARAWSADLVVIGRSGRGGVGQPYVGSHTRHVLEFADQPVLVVPQPG